MHYDIEFDMPEPKRLAIFGDWHGAGHWGGQMMARAQRSGCDAFLHLGDWGYYPSWDEHAQGQRGPCVFTHKMRKLAQELGLHGYWLDGNHENHEALTPGEGDEWLRHLPRGHRWQWWDKTWMSVGGGVSVNKHQLTPGLDYFPEETLTPEQFDHIVRPGDVDIIVAHDCPAGVDIPGTHVELKGNASFWPAEAIRASNNHRDIMALIAEDKLPDYWFHGHYHTRHNSTWEQPFPAAASTMVVGLDCNHPAGPPDFNIVVLTKEDL